MNYNYIKITVFSNTYFGELLKTDPHPAYRLVDDKGIYIFLGTPHKSEEITKEEYDREFEKIKTLLQI